MITITGRDVLPENDVAPTLYDIGYGLAGIRRFGAQTARPWTVLQHSIACARFALYRSWPAVAKLHCLVHDAGEPVTGDVTYPWKTRDFEERQEELDLRIWRELGMEPPGAIVKTMVKYADYAILYAEAFAVGTAEQQQTIGKWLGIARPEADAMNAVASVGRETEPDEVVNQAYLAEMFVKLFERLKGQL